jgi:hypothetical protein
MGAFAAPLRLKLLEFPQALSVEERSPSLPAGPCLRPRNISFEPF